ncbi:o-succinylbenzoate synthase [Kaistella palustris]|uniref:o-succinylbenzoate synthase n=1 Tax=Kaistella palustris TaxID=493376 RepID=UPI0004161C7E|nr:o-succinylbenzoate synthase [Kaistella palustris]
MTADFKSHILQFKRPGGTSRGVLHTKETYILTVEENGRKGIGECALFRGLSSDDVPGYEEILSWFCENINAEPELLEERLKRFPSIWCGYEQALLNLKNGGSLYFPSDFTAGKASLKINGLIWMGDVPYMQAQIQEKLAAGFDCIKLKIGVDWPAEKKILTTLRREFSRDQIELRVDANGGFTSEEAKTVLRELAELEIHSIEQPIKAGNRNQMQTLCRETPTPIALDEELIGVVGISQKKQLLEKIKPQYIILKPSLIGGFSGTDEWISIADEMNIGWWITSALESNIGLNAIAQYTFTKKPKIPQGLGTGGLFTNNFPSDLVLTGDQLSMV